MHRKGSIFCTPFFATDILITWQSHDVIRKPKWLLCHRFNYDKVWLHFPWFTKPQSETYSRTSYITPMHLYQSPFLCSQQDNNVLCYIDYISAFVIPFLIKNHICNSFHRPPVPLRICAKWISITKSHLDFLLQHL